MPRRGRTPSASASLDEGLGIPSAERRRIFEKFYRLDPHMTRGIGGTGLGLYICRELVRRFGGRIWVEPNDGRGAAFHLEVPIAQAAGAAGAIGSRSGGARRHGAPRRTRAAGRRGSS